MVSTNGDYELRIRQMMAQLSKAGMQVMRTFDLDSSCGNELGVCVHHGSSPCDCRLTVLIISGHNATVTVTAHQCDGHIWLSLDESQQPGNEGIEASITTAAALVKFEM